MQMVKDSWRVSGKGTEAGELGHLQLDAGKEVGQG
jgi:hypothetical protein